MIYGPVDFSTAVSYSTHLHGTIYIDQRLQEEQETAKLAYSCRNNYRYHMMAVLSRRLRY